MANEKTDVVIIGIGAAGGILAAELGKAGMKVIGLERGPRLKTDDFSPHDELRYFQRQDLRPNVKRLPVTWRPNVNTRATPLPILNYGNRAALELWELDWDRLTRMPSRETAEPMHRDERAEFMDRVRKDGFLSGYRGIRIASSGKRFSIEDALIWNILDEQGRVCGQAATFEKWTAVG